MHTAHLVLTKEGKKHYLRLAYDARANAKATVTGSAYRISPIFLGFPKNAHQPDLKSTWYLGFFFYEHAFSTIGEILNAEEMDKHDSLWFSHGLASVLAFSRTRELLDRICKHHRTGLRAYEVWQVERHLVTVRK